MPYRLTDLPYAEDALAPLMSERTVRIHHGKHHARYVQAVNELTAGRTPEPPLEDLIVQASNTGDRKLFNNAAQAWNHGFFWASMAARSVRPSASLLQGIEAAFGSPADLKAAFVAEGAGHFGSGWVWLAAEGDTLKVLSTHDADTLLMQSTLKPLLVCDVWEHAYYLDHANDRAGFLNDWWDRLANWDFAARQLAGESWRYPAPV